MFMSLGTASPKHWGPAEWDHLFTLASHFPHKKHTPEDIPVSATVADQIRKVWKHHMNSFTQMIPCAACEAHFRSYQRLHPLDRALADRESLMRWLHAAKAEVRAAQGKKSVKFSSVQRRYVPSRQRLGRKPNDNSAQLYLSPSTGDPQHWGAVEWNHLFTLASNFPHERTAESDYRIDALQLAGIRRDWKTHLRSVAEILPCGICRKEFRKHMDEYPVDLSSRDSLFRWLYNAKAAVRARQGKRNIKLQTVMSRYIPKSS